MLRSASSLLVLIACLASSSCDLIDPPQVEVAEPEEESKRLGLLGFPIERTLANDEGAEIPALILGRDAYSITLRRTDQDNGKIYVYPISMLSAEGQEFVQRTEVGGVQPADIGAATFTPRETQESASGDWRIRRIRALRENIHDIDERIAESQSRSQQRALLKDRERYFEELKELQSLEN